MKLPKLNLKLPKLNIKLPHLPQMTKTQKLLSIAIAIFLLLDITAGIVLLVNKDKSLASSYVGQIIACIFQPVLLNSPGKIAANWFREDIRTVICTICCSAIILGALIGFLWNLLFSS